MNAQPSHPDRHPRHLLVALLLAVTSASVSAATYRWTDADGNVQYGNPPPPGIEAELIGAPPPPPTLPEVSGDAAATPGEAGAQPNQPAEDGQAAGEAATEPSEAAKQVDAQRREREARQMAETKRRNCQAARSNLERLENPRQLRLKQADGSTRRIDNAERQKMVREARKVIRQNCN
jgi:hypothetical protein